MHTEGIGHGPSTKHRIFYNIISILVNIQLHILQSNGKCYLSLFSSAVSDFVVFGVKLCSFLSNENYFIISSRVKSDFCVCE